MKNVLSSAAGLGIVITAALVLFTQAGFLDLNWPWENAKIVSDETVVAPVEEATIVEIERIALDCRARVHTVVPIEGSREHKALGQTYRTDTMSMTAVGDIDTCVSADDVEIITRDDGSIRVIIPADSITFERPRVDAVATYDSVEFDKGFVGKLTDAVPWVSDNNELTPAGYAYAQTVIGSSACNEAAYATTRDAILRAYENQLLASGLASTEIEVDIIGEPNFGSDSEEADLEDFDFEVDSAQTTCTLAPHATGGATVVANL